MKLDRRGFGKAKKQAGGMPRAGMIRTDAGCYKVADGMNRP
jgi:hypothetical protein